MIITLSGFMGSGKTVSGRELAGLLGWEFTDLDAYIREKTGRSIPDILADSEEYFRATEAEAVRDIITMMEITDGNLVLSLGGGTMTIPSLVPLILEKTKCVRLEVSARMALERLSKDRASRPLLPDNAAAVQALMDLREAGYSKAGYSVNTENISPREVAEQIRDLLF